MKYLLICLTLLLMACEDNDINDLSDSLFTSNSKIGIVENNLLKEVSGLVSSRSMPGTLWAHNDKGDGARIYLLHESGRHLGIVNLEGIAARDWEDMAIGPGPAEGVNYIYVADIGDNDEISKVLYVYRFIEPMYEDSDFPIETFITEVDVIEMEFNDKSRDAESLLIDPITKDLLIVTKNKNTSEVYRLRYPQLLTKRNPLEYVIDLPFDTAVGGDISSDGQEILIKNYDIIYYWNRNGLQSLSSIFSQKPTVLPYKMEPQGEAIAWKFDGSGYYSISEQVDSKSSPIFFYERN